MSRHSFHPTLREPLLDELKDLAKEMGCYGKFEGIPHLTDAKSLSLNGLLRIQIMMGATEDRTALSLELGANPNARLHKLSQLEAAQAYAKRYKDNSIVEQLESYGATNKEKKRPKKSV